MIYTISGKDPASYMQYNVHYATKCQFIRPQKGKDGVIHILNRLFASEQSAITYSLDDQGHNANIYVNR